MTMVRRLLLLLAACSATLACIWDSDTLGIEAKGMPGVLDVVTGRFDRNPPLYYEMRLTRVSAEVAKTPEDLALYDDAGAACDRLGRHDEAVQWMRRKAEQLAKHPDKEHQYRYHANLGTFLVHGWLASGATKEKVAALQEARDEIARAIAINPEAHFGREVVQLKVMEWLLVRTNAKGIAYDGNLGRFLWQGQDTKPSINGLVGLIALGNAWESPDIFEALASLLQGSRDFYLAGAAGARVKELLAAGKKPKGFEPVEGELGSYITDMAIIEGHIPTFRREVFTLRKSADERNALRESYMLARLKVGKHPDTHPDFWSDWHEPPRPELSMAKGLTPEDERARGIGMLLGLGVMVIVGGAVAFKFWRRRRVTS